MEGASELPQCMQARELERVRSEGLWWTRSASEQAPAVGLLVRGWYQNDPQEYVHVLYLADRSASRQQIVGQCQWSYELPGTVPQSPAALQ